MAPRIVVTTQKIVRGTGLLPALTAPTVDGDVIDADQVGLWVNNASGASINVTIQTPATQDGLDLAELVVPVAAGAQRIIGGFPSRSFARPTGQVDAGKVYVDYSAIASVTRAVIGF